MIKRLRVTVDGVSYDVSVELPDGAVAAPSLPSATPPVIQPASSPAPAVPQPAAAPAAPVAPAAPATTTAAAGPGDVPSPLAGRVTAVVVTLGQEVKEGDHLLTLEAMKMNTFVFAPKTGKVGELKAAVGDAVDEGQVLLRIS